MIRARLTVAITRTETICSRNMVDVAMVNMDLTGSLIYSDQDVLN